MAARYPEEPDESDSDVDHEESDEYCSDVDYFYEDRDDYDTCQTKFEKFKSLRERVDLKVEEDRGRFSRLLNELVDDWEDQLPDLREFFRREEIDLLLSEDILLYAGAGELRPLVEFVIRTGYKDEPKLDEDGNPVLRRTTPVHWAGRNTEEGLYPDPNMSILFEIYDRFDVNYTDKYGLTHFHVACMSGSEDIVEKFLELGQDPDCLTQELPLALKYEHKEVFELLLRYGADPNSINADGSTILQIILKRDDHGGYDDEWMEILFEVTDEKHQLILVNARDKLGRTPLHLAVANLLPGAVEILLDHGADVSNFVFPDYNDCDGVDNLLDRLDGMVEVSACMLVIVECLENKGYEISRRDVVSIMKLFDNHYWFTVYYTNIEFCLRNKEVANNLKKLIINPGLSFYDSIWLSTEETRKRITCKDFLRFATSYEWMMSDFIYRDNGMQQLNAKMWRGFCCRWGLDFFYEFINYRLPILCCKIIVDKLQITDLMNLCLAAGIDSKKQC